MQTESTVSKVPTELKVVFVTDLKEHMVDETPLTVQTKLDEKDLNKILNQLLGTEDNPTAFRFTINNKFLRGTLKSHMVAQGLFSEQTLTIKYDLSPLKPKLTKSQDNEDWIMAINEDEKGTFVVSMANGAVSLFSSECKLLAKSELIIAGAETVKSAAIVDVGQRSYVASGCQSGALYFRQVTANEIKAPSSYCKLDGEAIETMSTCPINPALLALGTSTGRAILVDASKVQNRNVSLKKGLKSIKTDMRVIETEAANSSHGGPINSIEWTSGNRFATASFDHNVRILDCDTFVESWNCYMKDLVPTALCYYPKSSTLMVGYEDGYIRQFDEREKSHKAVNLYKSHSKWVSKLAFLPSDSNIFASGSYDGTVKIWDVREELPLYTISSHKDKVFEVCWLEGQKLISGGTDNKYFIHQCDFSHSNKN